MLIFLIFGHNFSLNAFQNTDSMNMAEMETPVVLEESKKELQRAGSELFKTLCFNCDLRHQCTWKGNRKMYCEHFQ